MIDKSLNFLNFYHLKATRSIKFLFQVTGLGNYLPPTQTLSMLKKINSAFYLFENSFILNNALKNKENFLQPKLLEAIIVLADTLYEREFWPSNSNKTTTSYSAMYLVWKAAFNISDVHIVSTYKNFIQAHDTYIKAQDNETAEKLYLIMTKQFLAFVNSLFMLLFLTSAFLLPIDTTSNTLSNTLFSAIGLLTFIAFPMFRRWAEDKNQAKVAKIISQYSPSFFIKPILNDINDVEALSSYKLN